MTCQLVRQIKSSNAEKLETLRKHVCRYNIIGSHRVYLFVRCSLSLNMKQSNTWFSSLILCGFLAGLCSLLLQKGKSLTSLFNTVKKRNNEKEGNGTLASQMFQRALTQVINPDLLLGSRLVLLCKGSSHVVSPVSLEGPAEQSEPHRKHRWQRDGGNLRKHRKASHQELFRGRETPRNN